MDLDRATVKETKTGSVLQVPYEVEFDYNEKHFRMRLINHLGIQESILSKRDELLAQGKKARGRVFCLNIDEKETKVDVFSFSEKAFDYYHPEWVSPSFYTYKGTVENLRVKPVQAITQHFELTNIWEADGKWSSRSVDDPMWQKAKAIYPDSISLGILKTEDAFEVVQKLGEEADAKFRAVGADDEYVSLAPDYSHALVEYVGTTAFAVGSIDEWNSPVKFCEGNHEVGFNAVIDLASLGDRAKKEFVTELCESIGFVGFEYVLDEDVKKQLDPSQIGKVRLYIGPNESLTQAYKRSRIDIALKHKWTDWRKEIAHQNQLKTFAQKTVEKTKDEYNEVFELISDAVSDKELLAKTLERLKARDEAKTENCCSVQTVRCLKSTGR